MENKAKLIRPVVALLMGSERDYEVMQETKRVLDEFGVPCQVEVMSAHRTPERCRSFVRTASERGIKVIIAGAGKAAHLPGVVASYTTLPVIGVPLDVSLAGLDALLSIVQMPGGVPVACMAIGKAGAVNAALLAVEILALSDGKLKKKLIQYRRKQAAEVIAKSEQLKGGK